MQANPHIPTKIYVLVHGAYGGGWIWRDVAEGLRTLGHTVWAPTLTGLGERAHLLSRQITVGTHIQDVAGLVEAEELKDVILVGHSYGGMVVTGVADRMSGRVRHIVYLDALILEDGDTAFSILPPGLADSRRTAAREQGCESAMGFGADQREKTLKSPVTFGFRARADSHRMWAASWCKPFPNRP